MKCRRCDHDQRPPVTYYAHLPKVAGPWPDVEPEPVNYDATIYWACENCGRKHNRDGSLYVPRRSALEAIGEKE